MANLNIGPLYAEIGQLIAADVRDSVDGSLLYAEVEPGVVSCAIFENLGDELLYRDCADDLIRKIGKLWEEEDSNNRWYSIIYAIDDSKFVVDLGYGENLSAEDDFIDRRLRVVQARYGDKPIDYSDP